MPKDRCRNESNAQDAALILAPKVGAAITLARLEISYLSSQTSSIRQPLKMLLTIIVTPLT
jgi:hypothetical protein